MAGRFQQSELLTSGGLFAIRAGPRARPRPLKEIVGTRRASSLWLLTASSLNSRPSFLRRALIDTSQPIIGLDQMSAKPGEFQRREPTRWGFVHLLAALNVSRHPWKGRGLDE